MQRVGPDQVAMSWGTWHVECFKWHASLTSQKRLKSNSQRLIAASSKYSEKSRRGVEGGGNTLVVPRGAVGNEHGDLSLPFKLAWSRARARDGICEKGRDKAETRMGGDSIISWICYGGRLRMQNPKEEDWLYAREAWVCP